MERHDEMPANLTTRDAHVADDAADASAGHEDTVTFAPDFVEFFEESVVILDVTKLAVFAGILLEGPIRRGGHDQVYGCVRDSREVAGVPQGQGVRGLVEGPGPGRLPKTLIRRPINGESLSCVVGGGEFDFTPENPDDIGIFANHRGRIRDREAESDHHVTVVRRFDLAAWKRWLLRRESGQFLLAEG
jgi:hypothetical protein